MNYQHIEANGTTESFPTFQTPTNEGLRDPGVAFADSHRAFKRRKGRRRRRRKKFGEEGEEEREIKKIEEEEENRRGRKKKIEEEEEESEKKKEKKRRRRNSEEEKGKKKEEKGKLRKSKKKKKKKIEQEEEESNRRRIGEEERKEKKKKKEKENGKRLKGPFHAHENHYVLKKEQNSGDLKSPFIACLDDMLIMAMHHLCANMLSPWTVVWCIWEFDSENYPIDGVDEVDAAMLP
ncbi:hypothetical protein LguiB_004148 [Lonicera macranthoides]